MAYELKGLGWHDEDIKSISASISNQIMTISITLQDDSVIDTTVTLPNDKDTKPTSISNSISNNELITTVSLSDGTSVKSTAVTLPTIDISGKLDKITSTDNTKRAYTIEIDGTQSTTSIGKDEQGSIVIRDHDGMIQIPSFATSSYDVVCKDQMDEAIAAVAAAGPYYIDITAESGILTEEQYNKLKADLKSYIVLTTSTKKVIYHQERIVGDNLFYHTGYSTSTSIIGKIDLGGLIIQKSGTSVVYNTLTDSAQNIANKDNSITLSSTDNSYPSSKAVYTYGQTMLTNAKSYTDEQVGNINTLLAALDTGTGV